MSNFYLIFFPLLEPELLPELPREELDFCDEEELVLFELPEDDEDEETPEPPDDELLFFELDETVKLRLRDLPSRKETLLEVNLRWGHWISLARLEYFIETPDLLAILTSGFKSLNRRVEVLLAVLAARSTVPLEISRSIVSLLRNARSSDPLDWRSIAPRSTLLPAGLLTAPFNSLSIIFLLIEETMRLFLNAYTADR